MKKILNLAIIMIVCISCGDSYSKYINVIDNQTEYEIKMYYPDNENYILCPANKETIIMQMEAGSVKKLGCIPFSLKDQVRFIIDGGRKDLIKDFSDDNNWECTGDKDWSLIMVGSYYNHVKNTFIITDVDLADILSKEE